MNMCLRCNKPVSYRVVYSPRTFYKNCLKITYDEAKALCLECGNEIYVPEVNDINVENRIAAYYKMLKGE